MKPYLDKAERLVKYGLWRLMGTGVRKEYLKDLKFLAYLLREGLWRTAFRLSGGEGLARRAQQTVQWTVPIPAFEEAAGLVEWLGDRKIELAEGYHSIYLPPQDRLRELLGEVTEFYPEGAGFKILKDFRGPSEASYLTGASKRKLRLRVTGRPADQLLAANYLHGLGIGPRAWDVTAWNAGTNTHTVFVVDHVAGRPPRPAESSRFIDGLDRLLGTTELRILVPDWKSHVDFTLPGCGGNLVVPDGDAGPQYVDFQNFGLRDPGKWTRASLERGVADFHFGRSRPGRGSRYLYQSVPGFSAHGKRNMDRRWDLIEPALRDRGLDFAGRVVLDIGCNAGMVIFAALASGASWALGWDRAGVTTSAEQLLLSLGISRFDLFGRDLHESFDLRKDIPRGLHPRLNESVVFYLAVREHIGWMSCLREIPWRILVYEGHQGEGEVAEEELRALGGGDPVDVVLRTSAADGDCSPRPIAILVRR